MKRAERGWGLGQRTQVRDQGGLTRVAGPLFSIAASRGRSKLRACTLIWQLLARGVDNPLQCSKW